MKNPGEGEGRAASEEPLTPALSPPGCASRFWVESERRFIPACRSRGGSWASGRNHHTSTMRKRVSLQAHSLARRACIGTNSHRPLALLLQNRQQPVHSISPRIVMHTLPSKARGEGTRKEPVSDTDHPLATALPVFPDSSRWCGFMSPTHSPRMRHAHTLSGISGENSPVHECGTGRWFAVGVEPVAV